MPDSQPIRVDKEFKKALDKIRIERLKNGKDKRERTNARLTKAIMRTADFNKIEKEIINAKFKEE